MSFAAVLLAIALVAAPGLGLMLALFRPGRASLPTRVALVVPFGYAAIALTGLALALVHILYLATFLALYLVETAAAWIVALKRHRFGEHLAGWRREIAEERWPYLMGLLLILALGAIRLPYSGIINLFDQTPLRYWADGLEIADAHRVPAVSLQWGHLFPSTISKVALNAFNGTASLVLGRGPLAPMGALLFVASMGIFLAAFALARELGLRFTAPLLVVFLFANRVIGNRELTADLTKYRAENWGRLLMLAGALLVVRALGSEGFREGLRDALLAGALFGVLAGTHLVPFVVGVALVGSYGVGRILVRRGNALAVLKIGAATAAAAAILGGFILLAPRGSLGFQGAGAADAYRKLGVQLGLGPDWDPTLYLAQGKIVQPPHPDVNGFYNPPSYVYRGYIRKTVGETKVRQRFLYLVPVGMLVALVSLLVWGAPELKVMAIAATLTAVILLVATLYFSYRYDVYAIALFGERRLFDYTSLPIVLLGLGAGEMLLARVAGGALAGLRRPLPWAAPVAAALGLTMLAVVALPRDLPSRSQKAYLSTALSPLAWIERNVPCQGRILADRRTLATFEVFTRHAGVLEGMGPYLRPDVLGTAVKELLAARDFFKDPLAHEAYVRSRGVAAVVVTAYNLPLGGALKVAQVNTSGLDSAPFLTVAVRSPSVTIYRVTSFDQAAASSFPNVASRPGYNCG